MQELDFITRLFIALLFIAPLIGLTALLCWIADILDQAAERERSRVHYTWRQGGDANEFTRTNNGD